MLEEFLSAVWMHEKEQDIYLCITQFWQMSPAHVAEHLARERTSTYKLMMHMHQKWYLTMHGQGHKRLFGVIDVALLRQQLTQRVHQLTDMENNFSHIHHEFHTRKGTLSTTPSIQLLQWTLGMQKAYQTMLEHIHTHQLIHLTCFASQTHESFTSANLEAATAHQDFINTLESTWIHVDGFYGQGISLMESLLRSVQTADASHLPTANDAVWIRIAGDIISMFIMKKHPQIILITSHELSGMFQFLANQLP